METPNPIDTSWLGVALGAAVTQFFNWLMNRRKQAKEAAKADAEAQGAEIDNIEKAIAIWRKLAEEMNSQVVELKAQVRSLGEEISKLQAENVQLKSQVEQLAEENKILKDRINNEIRD